MRVLYAYAATVEGEAIAHRLPDGLQTGVGKTHSTMAIAERLSEGPQPELVCLFGLCGAYPEAKSPLAVGDLCMVGTDLLADEGLATKDGFTDLAQMGLGTVGPFQMDHAITAQAAASLGGVPIVGGTTVSTCSGTDERSLKLQERTGAHVETMEGAAVAAVCSRHGVPLVQLRCVSNRTGDRGHAGMDLERASTRVHEAVLQLVKKGWL